MSILHRVTVAAALLAALAPFGGAAAQQDTTTRSMPGMPGMKMAMPSVPKPRPPASATQPKATMKSTSASKAKKPRRVRVTTIKAAEARAKRADATAPAHHVMPSMSDSAMRQMPGMKDSAMKHDMPSMPDMEQRVKGDTTHAMRDMPSMSPAKHDSSMARMPEMNMAADTGRVHGMSGMKMIDGPLGIPMERTGSGTSWLPDDSPMHADHIVGGTWELMLHGVAFTMYDKQGSRRGDEQFSSVNWAMLMATRALSGGRLQLRGMLSAEPWTVGGHGYPLLLQTGETFQGQQLHDRQHPHDLFMELAGLYEHAVSDQLGVSLYVAPVGEPAVGPVAFPHRPSAMNDPMAPLGHHWQDATHITFGVLTAGVFTHSVRLEGSIFNGREPDENRTNFDYQGRSLDSYSSRLTWNPSAHLSLSGSYAYLKSPEAIRPDESQHRIDASIMNGQTFGDHGELATTFVFGGNRHAGTSHLEPSWLLESNLEFGGAHSVFGRAEYVQKGAQDLALGGGGAAGEFNVTSLVGGYVYEFDRVGSVRTGIGGRASIDFVPSALEPFYGTTRPAGFAIYVRFRPQRMSEGHEMRMGIPGDPPHTDGHSGHP